MKIQFNPKDFLQKLRIAKKVVDQRHFAMILHNVKIATNKKQGAVIHATDKETSIRLPVDCEIITPGEVLIPLADCVKVLAATKGKDATLEGIKGKAIIGGDVKTNFDVPHPDKFPNVIAFDQTAYHEISGKDFATMIRRTAFAADIKALRVALTGVWIELSKGKAVHAIGSDGNRLAWQQGQGKRVKGHEIQNVIVPIKTLVLLEKVINDSSAESSCVKMAIVQNKNKSQSVVFQCGGTTIWSSLVDAKVPIWRELLIGDDTACAIIKCGDLLSAIEQITVIDKKDDDPEMTMTFRDGQLELKNKRSDITIPVIFSDTANVLINPNRLTSMLKILDKDTDLEFHMKTDQPIMVRTSDGFCYLAMPSVNKNIAGVVVEGEQICTQ